MFMLGVLCIGLFLPGIRVVAQNAKPPTQLTYQGFLTDANGVPFGNSSPVNKTVIFRIYTALTGGTLVWSSQQVVTVDKGYFSVLLGQGSAGPEGEELFKSDLTGVFTGPGVSERYLELTADGTTISPRLRFFPSPYSLLSKSATDLVDPITGASSLVVSGGILGGNGAGLTNLSGASIASGTIAESRVPIISSAGKVANSATTATSANTANAIVARDGSGNFSAGTITAANFNGSGAGLTGLNASQIGTGTLDNARTTATSANTANAIVARDANGNIAAGQVVADSFKVSGTPTLILTSISRGSIFSPNPVPGITATFVSNYRTSNGRQNVNNDQNNWWKASRTDYGTILYTATIVVPAGEQWEVDYACMYYWATDDAGAIIWTLNDALLDDSKTFARSQYRGAIQFDQNFILTAGTHVARVKGVIGGGSDDDYIYFPDNYQPSHVVVRRYKVN